MDRQSGKRNRFDPARAPSDAARWCLDAGVSRRRIRRGARRRDSFVVRRTAMHFAGAEPYRRSPRRRIRDAAGGGQPDRPIKPRLDELGRRGVTCTSTSTQSTRIALGSGSPRRCDGNCALVATRHERGEMVSSALARNARNGERIVWRFFAPFEFAVTSSWSAPLCGRSLVLRCLHLPDSRERLFKRASALVVQRFRVGRVFDSGKSGAPSSLSRSWRRAVRSKARGASGSWLN